MGTDIHAYIEARMSESPDDESWRDWFFADSVLSEIDEQSGNEYYKDYSPYLGECVNRFPSSRNYPLFAIMAGVRDYAGEFNCISKPRGLPEDITLTTKKLAQYWEGNSHSHSWLYIDELVNYDWTQTVEIDQLVPKLVANAYNIFRHKESFGPEKLDAAVKHYYDGVVKGYYPAIHDREHVTIDVPYVNLVGKDVIEKLNKIHRYYQHSKLNVQQRIIFWFDN